MDTCLNCGDQATLLLCGRCDRKAREEMLIDEIRQGAARLGIPLNPDLEARLENWLNPGVWNEWGNGGAWDEYASSWSNAVSGPQLTLDDLKKAFDSMKAAMLPEFDLETF